MTRVSALVLLSLALAAPPAAASEPCEVAGESGFVMVDGSCMTPTRYDETFSAEALAQVEHHGQPGRSVAEVYGLVDDETPASDRLIGVGLVAEPFTFRAWLTWQVA